MNTPSAARPEPFLPLKDLLAPTLVPSLNERIDRFFSKAPTPSVHPVPYFITDPGIGCLSGVYGLVEQIADGRGFSIENIPKFSSSDAVAPKGHLFLYNIYLDELLSEQNLKLVIHAKLHAENRKDKPYPTVGVVMIDGAHRLSEGAQNYLASLIQEGLPVILVSTTATPNDLPMLGEALSQQTVVVRVKQELVLEKIPDAWRAKMEVRRLKDPSENLAQEDAVSPDRNPRP